MIEKLLKVCNLPSGKKYTAGINIKGEYLQKYGFEVDDIVRVEVSKNKITIRKTEQTKIITQMGIKNPSLLKMIEKLDLVA